MLRSFATAIAAAVTATLLGAIPAAGATAPAESAVGGRVFEWRDPLNHWPARAPETTQDGVTAVATDSITTLGVKDGRVIVWSQYFTEDDSIAMDTLTGVTDVAVLSGTRYAITNGRVVTWGKPLEFPLPDFTQSGIVEMVHSRTHFVFRNSAGEVATWRPFKRPSSRTAVPEAARTGADTITAGYAVSAVIKNGQPIIWIQGSTTLLEVPDVVKSDVIALHTSGLYGGFGEQYAFAAAKSDGSVWAWGYDSRDNTLNAPERLNINDTVVKIDDYLGNIIGLTASGKMVVLKHVITDKPFGLFPAARSGVRDFVADYTHFIVVRDPALPHPDPTVTMACQLNREKGEQPLLVCRGTTTQVPEGARVELAARVWPDEFRLRAVDGVTGKVRANGKFVIKTRNFEAVFRDAPQNWNRLILTGCYFDEYEWDWCPTKPANIAR